MAKVSGNVRKPKAYKTRSGKKRVGVSSLKNKVFEKKVLKVMKKQTESKQAYLTQTPIDFNSAISGSGDCLKVIPNIGIGAADNARVGDQIRAQSLTIRAILQMLPQAANQGAGVSKIAARIMVVTPKSFPNWYTASGNTSSWMGTLLKKGGTVTGFNGDISDLFALPNTDAVTVHYNKVCYFNQSWATSTTNSVALEQSHLVKFLKINLKLKNKLLKYDANVDSGLTPVNAGYFIVVGYCFVDGTSPDTLSTRIRLQYDTYFTYEDN